MRKVKKRAIDSLKNSFDKRSNRQVMLDFLRGKKRIVHIRLRSGTVVLHKFSDRRDGFGIVL